MQNEIPGRAGRDPTIDLLRVVAIGIVVVGHWATTTIVWGDGVVLSINALSEIEGTRIVTWVLQVMPLVFFAGGFANARSLQQEPRYLPFLRLRMGRLLIPALVFLGVWTVLGLGVEVFDPDGPGKVRAAEAAALPLWFLGIYLVVVGLAPAMMRLYRRFGLASVVGLAVLAGLVDVVALGFGATDVGGANYAVVWLFAHQVGYAYADGTLARWGRRGATLLVAVGAAAMILMVTAGSYPVSLVGVPGQPRSNAQPPSLMMVAATLWLVGLFLLASPRAGAWLQRAGPAATVPFLHRVILSAYLWHVSAMTFSAGVLHAAGFPEPDIGSGKWWVLRPVWVLAAILPLIGLLWLFGRFELHRGLFGTVADSGGLARIAAAGFGVFATAIALLGFGETGFFPFAADPGEAILVFRFNPLQNLFHLGVGLAALWSAFSGRAILAVTAGGAALFALAGAGELAGVVGRLGMNAFTGWSHLVIGVAALLLIVPASLSSAGALPESDRAATR